MVRQGDVAGRLAALERRCSRAESGTPGNDECALLLAEMCLLVTSIGQTRDDIAALGATDLIGRRVPAAADELAAVVTHTAAATSLIMDECERLEQALAGTEHKADVGMAAARIYEACSFQDITGQRVAKVVQTLQLVEARLGAILLAFGQSAAVPDVEPPAVGLLNGPQSVDCAMDQLAVDALLASFE